MSKIDDAMARVTAALDKLEKAIADAPVAPAEPKGNDRLREEIRVLRARAKEDAELRAEAAGAVREALRDLRGAMTRGQSGEQANA